MTDHHPIDQSLISGYLDGELTQADRQRVSLHLEDCDRCRRTAADIEQLTGATMTSQFKIPNDTQWDERPQTGVSRLLLRLVWAAAGLWAIGLVALVVAEARGTAGEGLQLAVTFGLWGVFGVVLLAALADRLRHRRNDPYRSVDK